MTKKRTIHFYHRDLPPDVLARYGFDQKDIEVCSFGDKDYMADLLYQIGAFKRLDKAFEWEGMLRIPLGYSTRSEYVNFESITLRILNKPTITILKEDTKQIVKNALTEMGRTTTAKIVSRVKGVEQNYEYDGEFTGFIPDLSDVFTSTKIKFPRRVD